MRIAILAGCGSAMSPLFFSEAELLCEALAREGFELELWSRREGLSGYVFERAGRHGARVTERAHQFRAGSQAAVGISHLLVLPGGLGTIESLLTVLRWKRDGSFDGAVVLHNFLDVYNPLIETLTLLREQSFVDRPLDELFTSLENHQEVIDCLKKRG